MGRDRADRSSCPPRCSSPRDLAAIDLGPAVSAAAGGRPNLLLITVDTLRADFLGCYGFSGGNTPNLDRLAEAGRPVRGHHLRHRQDRPGVRVALLVALPTDARRAPQRRAHARGRAGARREAARGRLRHRRVRLQLDAEEPPLRYASRLRPVRRRELRPRAQQLRRGRARRRRHHPRGAALARVGARAISPVFLWVHYSEPHSPYDLRAAIRPQGREKGDGDGPRSRRYKYSSEVGYVDTWIGNFLARAEKRLPPESTFVVFLSDHGESLGEHDYWGHGKNTHWPNLRIPLILRGPGIPAGRRVDRGASIVDVPPTVLDLLGWPPLAGASKARSLARELERPGSRRPICASPWASARPRSPRRVASTTTIRW